MDPLDELSRGKASRLAMAVMATLIYVWIFPIIDTLVAAWPFTVTSIQWRYVTMVSLAPSVMTQALALAAGAALAWVLGWREALRTVAYVTLTVVGLAVLGLALHVMDYLQLIRSVPPDAKRRFQAGMVRWLVQLLSGAGVLAGVGIGALRAARAARDIAKVKAADKVILRGGVRERPSQAGRAEP